jgi:hypothetical protein
MSQIRRYIFTHEGKNTKFVLAENHESKVDALVTQIEKLTKQVKELKAKVANG